MSLSYVLNCGMRDDFSHDGPPDLAVWVQLLTTHHAESGAVTGATSQQHLDHGRHWQLRDTELLTVPSSSNDTPVDLLR